jgi:hypothetical protein
MAIWLGRRRAASVLHEEGIRGFNPAGGALKFDCLPHDQSASTDSATLSSRILIPVSPSQHPKVIGY